LRQSGSNIPSPGKNPTRAAPTRSVGFLLIPGFALMSYASAVEPLRAANWLAGRTLYEWRHAAPGDQPVIASSGAAILPDFTFADDVRALDLVLVIAGGNPAAFNDRRTLSWLRRLARQKVAVGGVSAGPYLLAKAGLLAGRRCTVHSEHMPAFQEAFPDAKLTRSLFEIDGDRITCSGGVAALDMMIALIARDHGAALAAAVSDWFLHGYERDGASPHRRDSGLRPVILDEGVLTVLSAMEESIEEPLPRARLAALGGVSLRQLERAFRLHVHRGVHQHYLALRLDRARRLLQETSLAVVEVALATGFASSSQFARAFRRAFGIAPREAASRRALLPESALREV
jgi:transcriptional regulator GlxA family with amidase domain